MSEAWQCLTKDSMHDYTSLLDRRKSAFHNEVGLFTAAYSPFVFADVWRA